METIYKGFLKNLVLNIDNLSEYVDSLYKGREFSENDLNQIFGMLKSEGLITCIYADNRAWVQQITFKGKHFLDGEMEYEVKVPRLIELIKQIDVVENSFHMAGGNGLPKVNEIHDTQIFQDWIQELQFELHELDKIRHDEYLADTLAIVSSPFNGWNDQKKFMELKAKLRVIKKNKEKYFMAYKDSEDDIMVETKKPLIFVSHSSQNKAQVKMLVELLRAINLQPQKDIFCSSLPGYDIPIDMDIFEFLSNRFLKYDLHVICVHSKEYYESPVSLNEMGAAWALKKQVTSILLPGFEFGGMRGVINDRKIAIKLDNDLAEVKDKLNQLRKMMEEEFNLASIPDIAWEEARDKFIRAINKSTNGLGRSINCSSY